MIIKKRLMLFVILIATCTGWFTFREILFSEIKEKLNSNSTLLYSEFKDYQNITDKIQDRLKYIQDKQTIDKTKISNLNDISNLDLSKLTVADLQILTHKCTEIFSETLHNYHEYNTTTWYYVTVLFLKDISMLIFSIILGLIIFIKVINWLVYLESGSIEAAQFRLTVLIGMTILFIFLSLTIPPTSVFINAIVCLPITLIEWYVMSRIFIYTLYEPKE